MIFADVCGERKFKCNSDTGKCGGLSSISEEFSVIETGEQDVGKMLRGLCSINIVRRNVTSVTSSISRIR